MAPVVGEAELQWQLLLPPAEVIVQGPEVKVQWVEQGQLQWVGQDQLDDANKHEAQAIEHFLGFDTFLNIYCIIIYKFVCILLIVIGQIMQSYT